MAEKNMFDNYFSDRTVFGSLGKGWHLAFSDFWVFLGMILLLFLIDMLSSIPVGDQALNSLFALLWSIFLTGPLYVSVAWVFLKAARKDTYVFTDMFTVFKRNYWNVVGATLLTGILTLVGLILLIIPGIIVGIRLSFVPYLVMDKKLGATDAIKASWKITKGYSWTIFGLWIMAILIIMAGFLVLFVGVFVSAIWISATMAVLYTSIVSKKEATIVKKK